MDDFLIKFFPVVYEKKHRAKENNYCKYDSQLLQLFTSSLYLAAIVASFASTFFTKRFGRKLTIQMASILFVAGAILSTFAINRPLLIAGRILLGAGVGFGNQVRTIILLRGFFFFLRSLHACIQVLHGANFLFFIYKIFYDII